MNLLRLVPRARFQPFAHACLVSICWAVFAIGCNATIADRPSDLRDAQATIAVPHAGPSLLRRLTNSEYDRFVRDVLGETTSASAAFPADPKVAGFDNNAASLTISAFHAERYRDASERISAAIVASPARRDSVIGCDPTGDGRADCLRSFVLKFGRRAFRRPLTETEIAALLHVADIAGNDADPYAGAALIMQAVLQSPTFLFRTELGEPDPLHQERNQLHSYELAARLSYFLWGTAPDDALLDLARDGVLDQVEGLRSTALAMLDDPRSHEGMASFYTQWLQLYTLYDVTRDAADYPTWTPELRDAMVSETSRVVDDLIWQDGANFLDLLTARYTYVNAPLARLYGYPQPKNAPWARVNLSTSSTRGGLLTQASYLTLSAHSLGSTLIHRGEYVRDVLLCQPLPPPPPNVPSIPQSIPGETDIERLNRHLQDPSCSNCHRLMDPIGLGMRRYDMIGAYIPNDPQMNLLSEQGNLYGFTPSAFDGPFDLSQRIHDAPEFPQCVARHLFRFAFGRRETMTNDGDLPEIQMLSERFQSTQYQFRDLVLTLILSDPFRFTLPLAGGHS